MQERDAEPWMEKMTNNNTKAIPCTKGIILAGGTGSRLAPVTPILNKHLLPVYDKPMIYYPLTTLMLGGIRDILIISSSRDLSTFQEMIGDGDQWGINVTYACQDRAAGLPEAFIIGKDFIGDDPVALILGDNVFHGQGLSTLISMHAADVSGARFFAFHVKDPRRYGVVVIDEKGRPVDIEEKPENPKSNLAIPGFYFFDNSVVQRSHVLKPSARGELEITDLIRDYISSNEASVHLLGRGYVWFDAGTPISLSQASDYVRVIQSRQDIGIACPEEVAWRMRYIDTAQLRKLTTEFPDCDYGHYLTGLLEKTN